MYYNITYPVKVPSIYYFLLLCSEMQAKSEPHSASSSCFRFRKAGLTRRRWGVMIYGPSWLEVDAILEEYCAPTPPTYAPPAEASPSQAAFVCAWIIQ